MRSLKALQKHHIMKSFLTWEPWSLKLAAVHSQQVPSALYYESRSLQYSVVIHKSVSYDQKLLKRPLVTETATTMWMVWLVNQLLISVCKLKRKRKLRNFENAFANFIYFDALGEGDGGGCSVGGSSSIVSHGQTLQAVPDDSKVVSRCFGGSLDWKCKALAIVGTSRLTFSWNSKQNNKIKKNRKQNASVNKLVYVSL